MTFNKERLAVLGLFGISASLFGYVGVEIPRELEQLSNNQQSALRFRQMTYEYGYSPDYRPELNDSDEVYISPVFGVDRDK